jgi:putative intracellular protease/amidase
MKSKAYLVVFDGLADWEPAHAFCEISKSGKFEVVTAGFSRHTVITMGGLKLKPDVTLEDVNPADAAFFMLPGGDMWQNNSFPEVKALLRRLREREVLIGAICAATLEIARAGLTRGIRHTSNSKAFLKAFVPDYTDDSFYVDELAVADQKLITASGLGSVEFAREVIRELSIYNAADTAIWFDMFKRGLVPAGMV